MTQLSPSGASRRVACPGSRALEELYPGDKDTSHAKEGLAAHWIAQEMILNARDATWKIPDKSYNGISVTEEMIEGAELYADDILQVLRVATGDEAIELLHIEEYLPITTIHPECAGTPDCWFEHQGVVYIWDYKFGHGLVEVYENWQLLEYAAGILDKIGGDDRKMRVEFCIVQPRGYHPEGAVRKWNVRASDLRAHFNILRAAEEASLQPSAVCNPSPECKYCTARHACQALQRTSLASADISMQNVPLQLEPENLANELRFLQHAQKMLEARLTGLEEQAIAMLRRGDRLTFFAVKQHVGNRRWAKDAEEVFILGDLMGVDLRDKPKPVTPAKAEKAGISKELLDSYVERPLGAFKLTASQGDNAKKIFGRNPQCKESQITK